MFKTHILNSSNDTYEDIYVYTSYHDLTGAAGCYIGMDGSGDCLFVDKPEIDGLIKLLEIAKKELENDLI